MTYAYYNAHGDITSVCSHPNMPGDHIEVEVGLQPNEWWVDPATGELHAREAHEWPESVVLSEGLAIPSYDCCAVLIDGVKQPPGSTFLPEGPGRHLVTMIGRRVGNASVHFVDYAAQRAAAYPSYADQFDKLYHEGYDAWRATIEAVKDAYPKA